MQCRHLLIEFMQPAKHGPRNNAPSLHMFDSMYASVFLHRILSRMLPSESSKSWFFCCRTTSYSLFLQLMVTPFCTTIPICINRIQIAVEPLQHILLDQHCINSHRESRTLTLCPSELMLRQVQPEAKPNRTGRSQEIVLIPEMDLTLNPLHNILADSWISSCTADVPDA